MTLEILAGKGISRKAGHFNIPTTSPFSVTVPGAPAAWCETVEMFGNKKVRISYQNNPVIHSSYYDVYSKGKNRSQMVRFNELRTSTV